MVYHVMKDGTIKKDITGHVVKIKDAEQVYEIIRNIERGTIKKTKSA